MKCDKISVIAIPKHNPKDDINQIMLEYIFFNKQTCNLFAEAVISSGISPDISCEDEYFSVRLAEDSNEDTLESLEDYYDELMDMERTLAEQSQACVFWPT